ncbi:MULTISPECIES: NYN domain-containing protein [unclassified Caballeronia]|uniref:NYN domain-containing protein n=1 Tax=unclassified Caballeronia TaxID=2646786 RepID=UPI001F4024A5|nr:MULTISPECIES: NYN domain-containing protein [unclassified Caballeronia]MCE4547157.1 NYN domain-containing protein [Caballeronia sp. PC1]MCE4572369.1 NYN domain-containing protein [Caballeronia sp. CLC5]
MAGPQESVSMAVFCDFENVALGVRDAKYEKFDIKPVLERLLLKGSIVVKKAYCDWDRYKGFKAAMHEASFEMIEIPHVRQSGKNSADIRLVVDALDLCYTKSHVDTFVIISGDSDFSPLVSKLRENAKKVIGVGVKQSTSDLLVANCDEFIFYDDLVREQQRAQAKRDARETRRAPEEERQPKQEMDSRKSQAIAIAVETFEALASERGESGKIWASVLKSAIKRRKPGFSESQYGFRAFGNLLDEAQSRGLLEVGRDDKSGAFVFRSAQVAAVDVRPADVPPAATRDKEAGGNGKRREKPGKRKPVVQDAQDVFALEEPEVHAPVPEPVFAPESEPEVELEPTPAPAPAPAPKKPAAPRRARKTAAKRSADVVPEGASEPAETEARKPPRKSSRASRPRKAAEKSTEQ